MQRRVFLRTGVAWAALGVGGLATLPRRMPAAPSRRRHTAGPIRLSSNENPLGMGPAARRAVIDALGEAHRYPGAQRRRLVETLAAAHGISPDAILLGAGSTEVLRIAVHAFCPTGGRLVAADPTFEDVPRYAAATGLDVATVALRGDGAHDLERMAAVALAGVGPALVYVCNPNNPTGTVTPSDAVDRLLAALPERGLLMVDEAYHDYVTDPAYRSLLARAPELPNVLVVRTFSKIYGMAGMRLGYGVTHPATAARLRDFATRNNANQLAIAAARASLADRGFVRQSLEVNTAGRRMVLECLDELALPYFPSHTNFVFHRINGDLDGYNARMLEHGIRVGRPFPPMLDHSRVSIGLPDEMAQFVETLRRFRRRGWA